MQSNIQTKYGVLSAQEKSTYYIDYSSYSNDPTIISFQELLNKVYGTLIEIGSDNNSTYEISVSYKQDLDEYEFNILNTCIKKKYMEDYNLDLFIQDLVNKDILPCGNYVVSVSW